MDSSNAPKYHHEVYENEGKFGNKTGQEWDVTLLHLTQCLKCERLRAVRQMSMPPVGVIELRSSQGLRLKKGEQ